MVDLNKMEHLNAERWVWTSENPDMELIEPRILVSVDKNWLIFGHQREKPSISHCLKLINHGDHPVAFKVHTSDNFAYFVDKETGMIPGKRMYGLPNVQVKNSVDLNVYRRPYAYFSRRYFDQFQRCKAPRKDRLFIYLAPMFGWTTEPGAVFTHVVPYEKLRVCLEYTASKLDPNIMTATSYLFEYRHGWNTWQTHKELKKIQEKLSKDAATNYQNLIEEKRKTTYIKPKEVPKPKKKSNPNTVDKVNPKSEEKTPDETLMNDNK